MRLQLHHGPLLLRGTASGLWGEATDGGDRGRWGGEGGQQAGPQAALQGAERASGPAWQQQQGGAALPVQQERLIDQLLHDVHFLSPVQLGGRRLLWSCRRSWGGAVCIPGRVTARLRGVWRRWRRGERRLLPTGVSSHVGRLLPGLLPVPAPPTISLLFVAVLQSFIDGAEARGRRQEDSLARIGLLQLLLPLHDLLSLLQLFLLPLQLQLQVPPLLQLLFLPRLQRLIFLLLYFSPGFLIFLPLSLLRCLLQRAAGLQLQQLLVVLLQPAELGAGVLRAQAPGWEGSRGELGRALPSPTRPDNVAVVSGACCVIGTVRVREGSEACV